MAGMIKAIKEYLRTCHGVIRASLAYVIRKTIVVQVHGEYISYATPDDKIITKMLHLPPDKNRLKLESSKKHTQEYEIDSRTIYNIIYHICKDTDLYPYFKQHKSMRGSRGAFYAIHSR